MTSFDSPLWNVGGLLVGLVGLVTATVFYRRSRRFKEPRWTSRGRLVLADIPELSDIIIHYREQRVERVAVDRVAIWNAGRETIDRTDLVPSDQLRVHVCDQGQILDVTVLACNNPPTEPSITLAPDFRSAQIDFAYLDEGHGFVVQVINTSQEKIRVAGSIKGAVKLEERRAASLAPFDRLLPSKLRRRAKRRAIQFAMATVSLGAAAGLIGLLASDATRTAADWMAIGLTSFYLVLGLLALGVYLGPRLPNGLEVFDSELP